MNKYYIVLHLKKNVKPLRLVDINTIDILCIAIKFEVLWINTLICTTNAQR